MRYMGAYNIQPRWRARQLLCSNLGFWEGMGWILDFFCFSYMANLIPPYWRCSATFF